MSTVTLETLAEGLEAIRGDIAGVKQDVQHVKEDVKDLKKDIGDLDLSMQARFKEHRKGISAELKAELRQKPASPQGATQQGAAASTARA